MTHLSIKAVWNATLKSYAVKTVKLDDKPIPYKMLSKNVKEDIKVWIWYFNIAYPSSGPKKFDIYPGD